MKISITGNNTMSAALSKVQKGEFFDALCLFARVDSYESMLNQIGCLCQLRDIGYACELYRKLLARYCFTHNCFTDVRKLGEATELFMMYFGNEPKGDLALELPDRLSANEDLLGFYPVDLGEDDFDYFTEFAEAIVDSRLEPPSKKSVFYDVKSPDYFTSLRRRMEQAYIEGNVTKGRALQNEYLDIDTDDMPTLEMQLFLCYTQQLWERGMPFAEKVSSSKQSTLRAMCFATHIFAHAGKQYQPQLIALFSRLIPFGEEITDTEMADYVQLAAANLGYGDITKKLADILYSHYKDAGCSSLRLCSRVYFNCGEVALARDATLTLLRATPWDSYAKTLLYYINKGISATLDTPTGLNGLARHFEVPSQLAVMAQYALFKTAEQGDNLLDAHSYHFLDYLCKSCNSRILLGEMDRFVKEITALSALMSTLVPTDRRQFEYFVKEHLCMALPEPSITKDFLAKLLVIGYKDKVLISCSQSFYSLDLSRIKLTDDSTFVSVLAICATLRKVDAKRIERNYKMLKDEILVDNNVAPALIRPIAYCVLAISYKNFTESRESEYFSDEEKRLYNELLLGFDS